MEKSRTVNYNCASESTSITNVLFNVSRGLSSVPEICDLNRG